MTIASEIASGALVAALYGALFLAVELWGRHTNVAREFTRKGVHIGGGMIALALPSLFASHWSVLILASLLTIALLVARQRSLLPSVQGIERITYGEVIYPAGIYLTLLLSTLTSRPAFFTIAILTLAFADGLAGIVGQRFKRHTYRVAGGEKSLEGSLTFFVVCAAIVAIALVVGDLRAVPHALAIAVVVALVTTSIEAVSSHGVDNVTVPVGCWVMLALTDTRVINELLAKL